MRVTGCTSHLPPSRAGHRCVGIHLTSSRQTSGAAQELAAPQRGIACAARYKGSCQRSHRSLLRLTWPDPAPYAITPPATSTLNASSETLVTDSSKRQHADTAHKTLSTSLLSTQQHPFEWAKVLPRSHLWGLKDRYPGHSHLDGTTGKKGRPFPAYAHTLLYTETRWV